MISASQSPLGTVYCEGSTHVWLGASSLCTCEAHKAAMMYGHPMNYNPFSHHAPQKASQTDVPIAQFNAAKGILGATHLSADGERVYIQKMGELRVCHWNKEMKRYDSSFPCDGLPGDAVKIE